MHTPDLPTMSQGNKCAVFTLQRLGFEVDPIYSVQFSNHTGYPSFKGDVFQGQALEGLMTGLEDNQLTRYSHLLTGYIGSVSLLKMIAEVARKLRDWNGGKLTYGERHDLVFMLVCMYIQESIKEASSFQLVCDPFITLIFRVPPAVCDPVMGDIMGGQERLYVPHELVDAYRSEILPLASVLVPNQFEAELLSQRKITTVEEGFETCKRLQSKGPHTVVSSSIQYMNF